MISMGNEVRRTHVGNNYPYRHDNQVIWVGWNDYSNSSELKLRPEARSSPPPLGTDVIANNNH
jgi:pullulanase/glycogen debranching enzyme